MHARPDFRFAPSQWKTSLQSNAVCHWLGANLESAQHAIILDLKLWSCDPHVFATHAALYDTRCCVTTWPFWFLEPLSHFLAINLLKLLNCRTHMFRAFVSTSPGLDSIPSTGIAWTSKLVQRGVCKFPWLIRGQKFKFVICIIISETLFHMHLHKILSICVTQDSRELPLCWRNEQ